jgi:hypothetical protein
MTRPTRPTRRRRRIVAVAVMGAVLALALPTLGAGATTIGDETFSGTSVTSPFWESGGSGGAIGGWPGRTCLTAGTDTGANPVPGCNLGSPDADGSGAARLTPADNGKAGYLLFDDPLPIDYGLDISFRQAQYGGDGADGIAFFIVDGAVDLEAPGYFGGSLGYAPLVWLDEPGVAGGLLGIGLDVYGNFSSPDSDGEGCATPAPGQTPDRVVLRGPGDGLDGYCFLATSGPVDLRGADRAASTRLVRVLIDPDTEAEPEVTVFIDGVPVLQAPLPEAYLDAASFKFGFSGSTGGVTDNHEIWGLSVASVDPLPPVAVNVISEGYAPGTTFSVELTCSAPVIAGTTPSASRTFTFVSDGDGEAVPTAGSEAEIIGPATCSVTQATPPPGTASTTYECLEQQIGETACATAGAQASPVSFSANSTDTSLVTMVVTNVAVPAPPPVPTPTFTG